jgi:D-alanine-D-alanine ligase
MSFPSVQPVCRFQHVAVLKGGPGAEREVSLRSGGAVADALRSLDIRVEELDVREASFEIPDGVEAVFPVLHGSFGEDGTVQRRLEDLNLPYTGSRSWEMPRSFDKEITRALLIQAGVPVAEGEMIEPGEEITRAVPLVIKAPRQGSSIGLEIVTETARIPEALAGVRQFDERVLVESFVEGREVTVGFVGETVLPVIEIRPAEGTYDYEAKYERNDTQYLVPAPLEPEEEAAIVATARKAYQILGGRHFGRVDLRLPDSGDPVVLELNPIPGFTATSLMPKAAAALGIDFPSLCVLILNQAELSFSYGQNKT